MNAHLAQVNLDDLEPSSDEWQEYWLMAIQTAQKGVQVRRG